AVRWVIDQYPILDAEHDEDGGAEVTMAVSARPWLERLLLRLGDDVEVLDYSDGDALDVRRAAAARLLDRYRPPVP
ncbi:MAG: WYL domain-containing protein, partial [Actinomycetota bacterium]